MQRLAALEPELVPRYYETQIGRTLEVLVERVCDDRPGRVRGTDRHPVTVEMPGDARDLGACRTVTGIAAHADYLEAQTSWLQPSEARITSPALKTRAQSS